MVCPKLRRARVPEVQFTWIGGERMIGQGLESLFPMDEISIMGITEILRQYGKLKARIRETAEAVIAAKPDVLITVDLPEAIKVRRDLLPTEKNHRLIGCSVLEPDWLDEISSDDKVFISATGLFMYFEPGQVQGLLREIATRAPTAELYFDCIPPGFSARAMKGMQVTPQYKAPKMPWGISIDHIPNFLSQSGWDTIAAIIDQLFPDLAGGGHSWTWAPMRFII